MECADPVAERPEAPGSAAEVRSGRGGLTQFTVTVIRRRAILAAVDGATPRAQFLRLCNRAPALVNDEVPLSQETFCAAF